MSIERDSVTVPEESQSGVSELERLPYLIRVCDSAVVTFENVRIYLLTGNGSGDDDQTRIFNGVMVSAPKTCSPNRNMFSTFFVLILASAVCVYNAGKRISHVVPCWNGKRISHVVPCWNHNSYNKFSAK